MTSVPGPVVDPAVLLARAGLRSSSGRHRDAWIVAVHRQGPHPAPRTGGPAAWVAWGWQLLAAVAVGGAVLLAAPGAWRLLTLEPLTLAGLAAARVARPVATAAAGRLRRLEAMLAASLVPVAPVVAGLLRRHPVGLGVALLGTGILVVVGPRATGVGAPAPVREPDVDRLLDGLLTRLDAEAAVAVPAPVLLPGRVVDAVVPDGEETAVPPEDAALAAAFPMGLATPVPVVQAELGQDGLRLVAELRARHARRVQREGQESKPSPSRSSVPSHALR